MKKSMDRERKKVKEIKEEKMLCGRERVDGGLCMLSCKCKLCDVERKSCKRVGKVTPAWKRKK